MPHPFIVSMPCLLLVRLPTCTTILYADLRESEDDGVPDVNGRKALRSGWRGFDRHSLNGSSQPWSSRFDKPRTVENQRQQGDTCNLAACCCYYEPFLPVKHDVSLTNKIQPCQTCRTG